MSDDKNVTITEETSEINIRDIIHLTLKRWYWLALSIFLCCAIGLTYALTTPPVYTRTASIVIKDDSKGKSVSSELNNFADMGLFQSHSNIVDEVNKLQSPDILREVVVRLNLDKSYYTDGSFHKQIAYGPELPIEVSFPSISENASFNATIDINSDGKLSISDVKINGDDATLSGATDIALGDTIQSPVGPIVVKKSPYFISGNEYQFFMSRTPIQATVEKFTKELTVALKSDKGNTIDLTVIDQSPLRAEDIINGVIAVYNEAWIDNKNQISISTSNFITERLNVIENELGNVDHNISSYRSEHLVPDVQQAATMYMSENQAASAQILELNNQLQMTRHMRNYLTNENNKRQVLPVNSGIGNAAIENQITDYNTMMLQRNNYADNSSETHPIVMDLDTRLAGMRSAIISTIDNQVEALDTQIRNLQSSKNKTTAQIAANPTQAKYLLSVERQQKVKETLYLYLLQKREENELSQAFTAYNTQVITMPTGPDRPTAPAKAKIMMVAFLLGLIIPFGVTYLREMTNTKIRGRKDLENMTAPFLGEVPALKQPKNGPNLVVRQGARDVVNEAFRVLRTNICFMTTGEKNGSVMMVSSFNPGSGKTFIAVNLAVSLAIKGKKVVLIDGDLRRGSTSEYIGSPKIGISNYLIGEYNDIDKVMVKDSIIKGLTVIPVGSMPPNPTELLEMDKFADLIKSLRQQYDFVIIDCPPIEMMADAQIVEQLADRTLFVLRAGLLERSMLPELERIYQSKKFKNMGIILNNTKTDGTRYGYKYGNSYGNYGEYMSK